MKKASEYREHAEECRELARAAPVEQRAQLLDMAAMWDRLAEDRERMVERHPELAQPGEVDAERQRKAG